MESPGLESSPIVGRTIFRCRKDGYFPVLEGYQKLTHNIRKSKQGSFVGTGMASFPVSITFERTGVLTRTVDFKNENNDRWGRASDSKSILAVQRHIKFINEKFDQTACELFGAYSPASMRFKCRFLNLADGAVVREYEVKYSRD